MGPWNRCAEFDPLRAVWLGWEERPFVAGYPLEPALAALARSLTWAVPVVIPITDAAMEARIRQVLQNAAVPMDHVSFFPLPYPTMPWWRDFGPLFVRRGEECGVVDFDFSCWGTETPAAPTSRRHARIARLVARHRTQEVLVSRLVSEGGDLESNGRGTLMLVEAVEFSRNPNVSREDIEEEFRRLFGVRSFIWFPQGIREDDAPATGPVELEDGRQAFLTATTGGHVDEFCRFASPETVLLGEVSREEAARSPLGAENRARLEKAAAVLQGAARSSPTPLRILRIPMPDPETVPIHPGDPAYENLATVSFSRGETFPSGNGLQIVAAASYLNFVVANDVVVAPSYGTPGSPPTVRQKDEEALRVLQGAFPGRRVVAVPSLALNLGGGGMHCITQHEPA